MVMEDGVICGKRLKFNDCCRILLDRNPPHANAKDHTDDDEAECDY